jgi:hypothetical protein
MVTFSSDAQSSLYKDLRDKILLELYNCMYSYTLKSTNVSTTSAYLEGCKIESFFKQEIS